MRLTLTTSKIVSAGVHLCVANVEAAQLGVYSGVALGRYSTDLMAYQPVCESGLASVGKPDNSYNHCALLLLCFLLLVCRLGAPSSMLLLLLLLVCWPCSALFGLICLLL
jgi:hypothetical protein